MKKYTKRIIALFLAGTIGFSCIPMDIYAAETVSVEINELENTEEKEEVIIPDNNLGEENAIKDLPSEPVAGTADVKPAKPSITEEVTEDKVTEVVIENTVLEENEEKDNAVDGLPAEQRQLTILEIEQLSDNEGIINLHEKVVLEQLEKMFPVEVAVQIDGEHEQRNLPVRWICNVDYHSSEMQEYKFSPVFGGEYEVADNVVMPSITVKFSDADITEAQDETINEVTDIIFDVDSAVIGIGKTIQINAMVLPDDAAVKNLTWISSNLSVASVDAGTGLVTGAGEGTAEITAAANDGSGMTQTFSVTVNPEYTITYYLNGGINSINNPKAYSSSSEAIIFEEPARKGCSFGGWYSDKDFKVKISGIDAGSAGNKVLYAKWILNQYTIKFDANNRNAVGDMNNVNCTYEKSVTLPTAQFRLTGYLFGGWNTKPDGSGIKYSDGEEIKNLTPNHKETVNLYAQWRKLKYSITYIMNGGVNSLQNPGAYTATDTFMLQDATRNGCIFGGWYTDSGYKNRVTEIKRGNTGNKTFYAKWIRENYTISYILNGGINNVKNPSSYTNISGTIVLQKPTRTGYSFDGWYKESSFKTKITEIRNGSSGNIKLYAKWVPNKYSVRLHPANSTAIGSMENITCLYGEEKIIPSNKYIVEGYVFKGWNTKPDGSGIHYSNNAKIKNLTSVMNNTVVLYATWEKEKYSITYNMNGGTNSGKNPSSYTITSAAVIFNNATRGGYSFGGWYSDKNFKNRIYKIPKGSTGSYVLYAKWLPNKYQIRFHSSNSTATGSMDMLKCLYGELVTLPRNEYKLRGYYFGGWNTKADGTGTGYRDNVPVKNLTKGSNGVVTLYAQWKTANYNITYNLNGGVNHPRNPKRYTLNSPTIILQKPTRTGHTFGGWYSDSGYNSPISYIKKGSTGERALYAKWIPNQYSVRFSSANSKASGTMNSISCTYGKMAALPANQYKLNGYGFVCWNTKPNGTGINYKNGEQIKNLTATSKGTITLYAQWKKANYTITYNLDGGKNNIKNPASYSITSDTIILQNPVKPGYSFIGWYSDRECTKRLSQIKKGSTGNRAVYALWRGNQYTVRFNPNGKTAAGKMYDVYCTYGKTSTLPPSQYRMKGYSFSGWNTSQDGKGRNYKDNVEVKNMTTQPNAVLMLYAQWKRINYTITYIVNGGTNSPKNPNYYTIASATVALKNPSRVGYDFGGWYTDSQFKNRVTQVSYGSTGNKTFYAKWMKQ